VFHFTANFKLGKTHSTDDLCIRIPDRFIDQPALVVDDNATARHVLEKLLTSWGMKVESAENGQLAIDKVRETAKSSKIYKLFIVDSQMPGMDGYQLAENIRSFSQFDSATLVMMTPAGQRGDIADSDQLGVSSYLTKPITASELYEVMKLEYNPVNGGTRLFSNCGNKSKKTPADQPTVSPSHSLQVLLAEDNLVNKRLAVRMLEKLGHCVTHAENGLLAFKQVECKQFDIIFMDVQMPEMGGFESTRLIRDYEDKIGNRTPIIAMTAHALQGDKEKCLEAGMDDYLSKPIHTDQLQTIIEKWSAKKKGWC